MPVLPSHARARHTGFTLLEMSVVIVVIGLIVGGIVAGQSVIRQTQLSAVISEAQQYKSSANRFRDLYKALPGDYVDASEYWSGTSGGNGNGAIELFGENYRFWQHLALAGLISGNYTGTVSPLANTTVPAINVAVPASRLSTAFWSAGYLSQLSTVNHEFGYSDLANLQNNYLILSGRNISGWWIAQSALTPDEALQIDSKIDDGRPALGDVRGGFPNNTSCVTGNTSGASYNATGNTGQGCALGFILR